MPPPDSHPTAGAAPRFSLGRIVATPAALAALVVANVSPHTLLTRHAQGDWGDLGDEDRRENDRSLVRGLRLLSAYALPDETTLWIITEADHSATTLLLPNEY